MLNSAWDICLGKLMVEHRKAVNVHGQKYAMTFEVVNVAEFACSFVTKLCGWAKDSRQDIEKLCGPLTRVVFTQLQTSTTPLWFACVTLQTKSRLLYRASHAPATYRKFYTLGNSNWNKVPRDHYIEEVWPCSSYVHFLHGKWSGWDMATEQPVTQAFN